MYRQELQWYQKCSFCTFTGLIVLLLKQFVVLSTVSTESKGQVKLMPAANVDPVNLNAWAHKQKVEKKLTIGIRWRYRCESCHENDFTAKSLVLNVNTELVLSFWCYFGCYSVNSLLIYNLKNDTLEATL